MSYPSVFAGLWKAINFAYGCPGGPAPLICDSPNPIPASPLVAQAMTVTFGYTTTQDGIVFYPLATTAAINVGSDGNGETVTPASVTGNGLVGMDQVSFTADFANAHGKGDYISSATFGLQEAANQAGLAGGGIVVVDQEWVNKGGTQAMYTAVTLPTHVTKQSNTPNIT